MRDIIHTLPNEVLVGGGVATPVTPKWTSIKHAKQHFKRLPGLPNNIPYFT